MGLDVPHGRPLARLAARSAVSDGSVRRTLAGPYAPPTAVDDNRSSDSVVDDVGNLCTQVLRGLLMGEDPSSIRNRLAPELTTWSPRVFAMSRDQLFVALDGCQVAGDTLSEVSVVVTNTGQSQSRIYAEWRLSARFTGPGFIDDDILIEPTGRLLETAGALVLTFVDHVVTSVHCYYDDLALLEQLIAPS